MKTCLVLLLVEGLLDFLLESLFPDLLVLNFRICGFRFDKQSILFPQVLKSIVIETEYREDETRMKRSGEAEYLDSWVA